MKKNKKLFAILFFLFGLMVQAQDAFTEEKTLWECPTNSAIKITYRVSNYQNIIEINGPFNMPENIKITGVLRISEGSLVAPRQLSPGELQQAFIDHTSIVDKSNSSPTLEITIAEKYYSKEFTIYNTEVKPFVTFEGSCVDTAKQKELNEALGKSRAIRGIIKKDDGKKVRIKTKMAVMGVRG